MGDSTLLPNGKVVLYGGAKVGACRTAGRAVWYVHAGMVVIGWEVVAERYSCRCSSTVWGTVRVWGEEDGSCTGAAGRCMVTGAWMA